MPEAPAPMDLAAINSFLAQHFPITDRYGFEIEAADPAQTRMRMRSDASMLRAGGSLAGPALMALADGAVYVAILAATGQVKATTANLNINFLRPAPPGDLIALVTLLKTGRRLVVGQVVIHHAEAGVPLAQATVTYALHG